MIDFAFFYSLFLQVHSACGVNLLLVEIFAYNALAFPACKIVHIFCENAINDPVKKQIRKYFHNCSCVMVAQKL